MQSFLLVTQTFVDFDNISKLFASSFFENEDLNKFWLINKKILSEKIDQNWNSNLNSGRILRTSFDSKDDFREQLMDFYKKYTQPTLFFLGDLSNYSTELQEGMLRLLEEPPQNLYIVTYTQKLNNILGTILSRCHKIQLPKEIVLKNLDQNLLETVKEKLPSPAEACRILMTKKNELEIPDLKEVERIELDFWLWQIEAYLTEFYKKECYENSSSKSFGQYQYLAKLIFKVIQTMDLNQRNVQKKLALAWLKT
jgi:DNA polymerase III, delta subunit